MANHGARVRRHVARQGINKIEEFVDHCLSIENLIDPHSPFTGRRVKVDPEAEVEATEVPRLKSKRTTTQSFYQPRGVPRGAAEEDPRGAGQGEEVP